MSQTTELQNEVAKLKGELAARDAKFSKAGKAAHAGKTEEERAEFGRYVASFRKTTLPAKTIARMKRLRAKGLTLAAIAKACNVSEKTASKHCKSKGGRKAGL